TAVATLTYNGAVGLAPDIVQIVALSDLVEGALPAPATAPHCPAPTASTVTAYMFEPIGLPVGALVKINQAPNLVGSTPLPTGYLGTYPITCVDSNVLSPTTGSTQFAFQYTAATTGLAAQTQLNGPTASTPPALGGHLGPRAIIDVGVMNGNIPAPLVAFDEDDEMFLTLTN